MFRTVFKAFALVMLALALLCLARVFATESKSDPAATGVGAGPFARLLTLVAIRGPSGSSASVPLHPSTVTSAAVVRMAPGADVVEPLHPERFDTATVGVREIATQVVTNGTVAWDVNRAVPVNCFSNGRASEVRHRLGDDVVKGEVLLVVDSPDLADSLNNYRSAVSSVLLKQKALVRARRLYGFGVGPQKDVEQATDDLRQATLTRDVAAEHIRIIGGNPEQKIPLVTITAPVSGSIVEQNIQRGAAIKSLDASPNLFTIADLSRVWVLCDLYENNLSQVALGDTAEVTLVAYPDRSIAARVAQVSKVLDPTSRTAKVRLELENKDGIFRPGMFAAVKFTSSRKVSHTIVPGTAVLRLHDKCWVFRKENATQYRQIEVEAGRLLPDGMQEVKRGLREGETVIVNALQFATAAEQEGDQQ